jgi:hypothetical protein
MITYFLYDLLPVWLTRLGAVARESLTYRLLSRVWHFFAGLVRDSFCARYLADFGVFWQASWGKLWFPRKNFSKIRKNWLHLRKNGVK